MSLRNANFGLFLFFYIWLGEVVKTLGATRRNDIQSTREIHKLSS